MDHLEDTRADWTTQALNASEAAAQVARPGDAETLAALVGDISEKLKLDGAQISLADIGCGNGLVLSNLIADGMDVAGVDYSDAMIAEARRTLPTGEFLAQGSDKLPFQTGRFDRVLCYSIFHYFPSDQYAEDTLAELIRIAAPGAVILVGDVLDKTHERSIKDNSDPEIEKTLPLIHRYSAWRFYDSAWLMSIADANGATAEILLQPDTFRLRTYRRDLRITKA